MRIIRLERKKAKRHKKYASMSYEDRLNLKNKLLQDKILIENKNNLNNLVVIDELNDDSHSKTIIAIENNKYIELLNDDEIINDLLLQNEITNKDLGLPISNLKKSESKKNKIQDELQALKEFENLEIIKQNPAPTNTPPSKDHPKSTKENN